jgi:hypothetical protein
MNKYKGTFIKGSPNDYHLLGLFNDFFKNNLKKWRNIFYGNFYFYIFKTHLRYVFIIRINYEVFPYSKFRFINILFLDTFVKGGRGWYFFENNCFNIFTTIELMKLTNFRPGLQQDSTTKYHVKNINKIKKIIEFKLWQWWW